MDFIFIHYRPKIFIASTTQLLRIIVNDVSFFIRILIELKYKSIDFIERKLQLVSRLKIMHLVVYINSFISIYYSLS